MANQRIKSFVAERIIFSHFGEMPPNYITPEKHFTVAKRPALKDVTVTKNKSSQVVEKAEAEFTIVFKPPIRNVANAFFKNKEEKVCTSNKKECVTVNKGLWIEWGFDLRPDADYNALRKALEDINIYI